MLLYYDTLIIAIKRLINIPKKIKYLNEIIKKYIGIKFFHFIEIIKDLIETSPNISKVHKEKILMIHIMIGKFLISRSAVRISSSALETAVLITAVNFL